MNYRFNVAKMIKYQRTSDRRSSQISTIQKRLFNKKEKKLCFILSTLLIVLLAFTLASLFLLIKNEDCRSSSFTPIA
jgi:hypothetical protein